jgi:hypothetical protein
MREFLTPALWKQAKFSRHALKRSPRWSTQPLVMALVMMTWCCGDSLPERFESARACYVALHPKRKRPGRTVEGFEKALAKLPTAVLRVVATAVRRQLAMLLDLHSNGFVVLGCDGSRLECPRSAELEQRLDQAGKRHSAPTVWVTALVHLRSGVLWAWRLGRGTASERHHLMQMLPTLPAATLLVADAGFNGFELAQAIRAAGASFLIRMSAKVRLYRDDDGAREPWSDGLVYYWPTAAQDRRQLPLRLRLIRIRGRKKHQDVWLLTDVLSRRKLPKALAAQYYRWRWENEGLFRTYKRTMAKVKLLSRTVRPIHREAEGALLATQLLLAQGARAQQLSNKDPLIRCSPRQVLLAIRREIHRTPPQRHATKFGERLANARREQRCRRSAKVKRNWPRRGDHKPPKPPRILTLPDKLRALKIRLEQTTAA